MAKKTIKRFRRKGRWSANISEIQNTTIQATSQKFSATTTLTTNPVQSNTTVSQIYTVKNFEISFTMDKGDSTNPQQIEGLSFYIMFVPQGMNVGEDYNLQHPEYIMAYRFYGAPLIDSNTQNEVVPFRLKTRMARRLNTGDSIILFITGFNENDSTSRLKLNGLIRWWTKTNQTKNM